MSPVFPPVGTIGFVARVPLALAARLNDKMAVLTPGVLGLVPLELVVADKSGFGGPVPGVRRSVLIELIGPDELPAIRRTACVDHPSGRVRMGHGCSADDKGCAHCCPDRNEFRTREPVRQRS